MHHRLQWEQDHDLILCLKAAVVKLVLTVLVFKDIRQSCLLSFWETNKIFENREAIKANLQLCFICIGMEI